MKRGQEKPLGRPAVFVVSIILLLAVSSAVDYYRSRDRIYHGVSVYGVDLGGKTAGEAEALLRGKLTAERFSDRMMTIAAGNTGWNFTYAELGISAAVGEAVSEAFAQARDLIHILRYPARIRLRRSPVKLVLPYYVDYGMFSKATAQVAAAVSKPPVDAFLSLQDDRTHVTVIPDQPGAELDAEETAAAVLQELAAYPEIRPVAVRMRPVQAAVTASYLEGLQVRELISSFSTHFSQGNQDRVHNIRLAASVIDGTLVLPDNEFSFNQIVGNTTADLGYRKAPVILRGEIVEGVGGGICQVSSTLYNAVLLAGLDIVERKNHGLPVAYLPPGLDATVAYGSIDLKFFNGRNHAVWIRTFIEGERLSVKLYGKPIPGQEVKIITENLETIPFGEKTTQTAELPKGTRQKVKNGSPGYRVTVHRITYMNGEEIKREQLSRDSYKPMPTEYLVGTGDVPASRPADSGTIINGETIPET